MKQFVIFNPWKGPWNWIVFYQNSFVISPGFYISLLDATLGDLQTRPLTFNGFKVANYVLLLSFSFLLLGYTNASF